MSIFENFCQKLNHHQQQIESKKLRRKTIEHQRLIESQVKEKMPELSQDLKLRVMMKQEKIEVPDEKIEAFNEWIRINSSDENSRAVVDYATAWAVAMQQAIRDGKKIADVASELSHEVDLGITEFMYGFAVSALARFWKHGEELRRWHNLNTQLGDEGKKANEKGEVLNSALLVIRP